MDLSAELARFTTDKTLPGWVPEAATRIVSEAQKSAHLAAENQALAQQLKAAQLKTQALMLELAHHRRIRFGAKSEALSREQIDLFIEAWETDLAAIEAEVEKVLPAQPAKSPRARAGRQPLPDHLPRIEYRHEPLSCTCGQCGQALIKIGEDITEQLDIEPARFFVNRHIRPQFACRACERIEAAPIPAAIIDGGMASSGLFAWLIISKYVEHLPLYRLAHIAARQGVSLSRSTLAEWVGRIGVALQPLVDRLVELLLLRGVLHADETPVAQLEPGSGKTRRAYLWVYRSNDLEHGPPIVVFDYQTSRSGGHARSFPEGWNGHLMVDDFAGYKAIFGNDVIELGCLAHARRKYYELHEANQSPIAAEALRRIGALYAIERVGKYLGIEARQQLRQCEAVPALKALHEWLLDTRLSVALGTGTAKAIACSVKRWDALSRYAQTGHLPIDNNPAENVIRPIAIGRKNWLHVGSERAGHRAAAIQTLMATAKLNGIEPYAWLKETLEKLPTCPNSRIDELLPLRDRPT